MSILPVLSQGDAFCKDGYCMCPNVDNGVKLCSIHASIYEIRGDNQHDSNIYQSFCLLFYSPKFSDKRESEQNIFSFLGPLFYRTCKHDQDCKYEGGFCNSTISQCDCIKDYVPSKNKQRCVQSKCG